VTDHGGNSRPFPQEARPRKSWRIRTNRSHFLS